MSDAKPAYQVLARKYRPETFADLVGQEAMVRTLRNAFAADRIAQAFVMTGIRGTGKTTTVGKLARILVAEERTTLLAAADTFRAAAADQLSTWGERVGVEVVRGPEGGDPASVGFDAVREGIERGVDTVVVDTAGRTKGGRSCQRFQPAQSTR